MYNFFFQIDFSSIFLSLFIFFLFIFFFLHKRQITRCMIKNSITFLLYLVLNFSIPVFASKKARVKSYLSVSFQRVKHNTDIPE